VYLGAKKRYVNTLLFLSFYYNLPESQITHLQQIQNSLAHAVAKAPKSCHTTPILYSLHWLKIIERIEYKFLLLTYLPPNLHISTTSSLFNLVAALALDISSFWLDRQHHPRYA